ncbi:MAG TPA: hypothetical protein PK760_02780, partial [Flavobacteriales bacterium]|nr:hypothetical protein [Flavobacteriales bacterium]
DALRPLTREVEVVHHYRERVPYVGFNGSWLKAEEALPLQSGPLFRDSTERWLMYRPRESMVESYLIIIAGSDTMRIDLPEDQMPLWQRAIQRSGRDTPEVIRFHRGAYTMEALIADPWAVRNAKRISERMMADEEAAYKRQLAEQEAYYRSLPPPAAVSNREPPHTPTAEEIAREIKQRPGLKKVKVERVNTDTAWVRISGRVMLNGGCASAMPLLGVEMRTDTGWVERIPFEQEQMDCGMPWVDWDDHTVMIMLRWWVGAMSRVGEREMQPGTYRLVFMGANMEKMRTAAFEVSD